jgi:hypothetical protein
LAAALQSLANLQSQAGLGMSGNGSPGSAVNDLNSSLAALANFNSQNIFGSLGKRNEDDAIFNGIIWKYL